MAFIILFLFLLLAVALTKGAPVLLRPISQAPKSASLSNFSLIDLAALIWLLSLVPLILLATRAYLSLLSVVGTNLLIGNFERGYWIIATLLAATLALNWANGVRQLTALGIRDWKARGGYLAIAVPLAYLCPTCLILSLQLIVLDQQLRGFWGLLLILFSLLTGVISRAISSFAARQSHSAGKEQQSSPVETQSDPFAE